MTRSPRRRRSWRVVVALLATLALVVAACGDDGGGDGRDEEAADDGGGSGDGDEAVPDGPSAETADLLGSLAAAGVTCQETAEVAREEGTEERCLIDEGWIDLISLADEDARAAFVEGGGVLDCSFIIGLGGGGPITVTYIAGPNWVVRPPPDADVDALAEALGGVVRTKTCGGEGTGPGATPPGATEVLDRLDCEQTTTEAAPQGAQAADQCLRPGGWAQVYTFADAGARQAFQDAGSGFDCSFVSTLGGGVVGRTVAAGSTLVVVSDQREARAVADEIGGDLGVIDCPGVG